ncbi:MAG: site-2 protease family protein, partial [Thermomicrobiales bacterium]
MNFGPLGPLLIVYALLAVKVVLQLARTWNETWDDTFTAQDRSLVNQTAFFVLVPISVALHECGHALMVKVYGGDILDWGYYGFAGYVGYDPTNISPVGQMVITAAGTIVNILLAAIAIWLVFFRKPPMRAAFNELLVQFVIVSMLNALLLYPVLDLTSGMNGDWAQMYHGEVRWFSILVIAVQVLILLGMWWAWRDPGVQQRIADLTGRSA